MTLMPHEPAARRRSRQTPFVIPLLMLVGSPSLAGAVNEPACLEADAVLFAPDAVALDYLGRGLDVSGDTLMVSADSHESGGGQNSGAVYTFRVVSGEWTFEQKLEPEVPMFEGKYGYSLTLENDLAIVGHISSREFGYQAGAADVFERQAGTWARVQVLAGQGGVENELFGYAIDLEGDRAVIGAIGGLDAGGVDTGAAYVYERLGGTWTEVHRLTPPGERRGANFGASVGLDGDTILVGAPAGYGSDGTAGGLGYVFRFDGAAWNVEAELDVSDAHGFARAGRSVGLSGDYALVGAPGEWVDGLKTGSVRVHRRVGASWTLDRVLQHGDASEGDALGVTVAVHDGMAVAGASAKDSDIEETGAAYVFGLVGGEWIQITKLVRAVPEVWQWYGSGVAIDANSLAVSAGQDRGQNGEWRAGSVEVFSAFAACLNGDCDGACDATDNCPTVANDDQTDSDGDGVGDACEPPLGGGETLILLERLADGVISCWYEELEIPGAHDLHGGDLSSLLVDRLYLHDEQLACWWPAGPNLQEFQDISGAGRDRYYLLSATDVPATSGDDSRGTPRPDAASQCP